MNQPADTPSDSSKPDRAAETASAFEPRVQAAAPKQFGKSGAELAPASGVEASDPRFLAAQFQH
ncbi:MAG: hypothetical protein LH624_08990, partial [Cryobacterium sp.]|nr:hypothetical protein [Cryobacterium sp.]